MILLSSSCPEVFFVVQVSEFPSATFQGRVDIIPTPKESDLSMGGLLFRDKVTKFLAVFVMRFYDRYENHGQKDKRAKTTEENQKSCKEKCFAKSQFDHSQQFQESLGLPTGNPQCIKVSKPTKEIEC